MTDFPNKVVTVVLVFLMLVVAPITWSYVREEMKTERMVMNEIVAFLDKTTDKGTISQQDLDNFYIAVNASGGTYDVIVKAYTYTPVKKSDKEVRPVYVSTDYLVNGEPVPLNSGTLIKASVKEVGTSPTRRLLWTLLKLETGESKFGLVATVR